MHGRHEWRWSINILRYEGKRSKQGGTYINVRRYSRYPSGSLDWINNREDTTWEPKKIRWADRTNEDPAERKNIIVVLYSADNIFQDKMRLAN